jgi:uncharacterized membrane protein
VTGGVERVLRSIFILALAIAAPLLLAGLLTHSSHLLEAGVLTVMVTPLVGVVIVAVAMALARDWPFTGVALLVLAILMSSLYASTRMPPPTQAPGPGAPARR